MAEDAKHAADEAAEKMSGQEQEQVNEPKEAEKVEATDQDKEAAEKEDVKVEDKQVEEKADEDRAVETTDEKETESDEQKPSEDDEQKNTDEPGEKEDKTDDNKEIAISIELDADKLGKESHDDFQKSVREQIENCKFEIISSIQESVHKELQNSEKQIRKLERRRRVGFWVRDILILILAGVVGYFGYCLYDAQYFDFMKPACESENNCPVNSSEEQGDDTNTEPEPEIIKDTAWYVKNYGSLYDALKINLDADKVSAYYLYSGDYKASEIQPNYLLGMAYNQLNSNTTYDSTVGIVIPANDLRSAFTNLFGTADYFVKQNFMNGCVEFEYDKASDSFVTPAMQCVTKSNREIVEEVDEAYEEGNALYFITTAAIYDKNEQAFYNFDNLFKPMASNVQKDDLKKHEGLLNRYQYRFKKVDDKYYFSDIVKLK